MSKVMLLEPAVKKVYIRETGHAEQEATYLQLSDNLDVESIDYAISKGAAYLKNVREYCDKKKKSQCVILTANNRELGLKALSYLAQYDRISAGWDTDEYSCGNGYEEDDFDIYFDDYESEYDESGYRKSNIMSAWEECEDKIPIITKNELAMSFTDSSWEFPFGGMVGAGGQRNYRDEPYWKSCNHCCICILWEETVQGLLFGNQNEQDILDKAIDFFGSNNRVYILRVSEYLNQNVSDDVQQEWADEMNSEWNKLMLNHVLDGIDVCMGKDVLKPYLTSVLEEAIKAQNITLDKGIDNSTIVNTVVEMKDEQKCHYLCKMLEYATKEWDEEQERILYKEDIEAIVKLFVTNFKTQVNPKETLKKNIVGMEEIKEHISTIINGMKFQKLRKSRGLAEIGYHNVHLMIGAPGTAKTTMAKIMGDMMVEEGLLPNNRFVALNGAELKGQYVGQSAPRTRNIIENNDIIFIDEAYSLVPDNGEPDSYSQEVLAQLAIELEKHATDKLFIFAGYGGRNVSKENDKMKRFIDCNPGIKSRINSTLYFESYSEEQMYAIFSNLAKNYGFKLETGVKPLVTAYFATRVNDKNFGNGREARSLFETVVSFMGNRLMNGKDIKTEQLSLIKKCDVEAAIGKAKLSDSLQNAHAAGSVKFTV